MHGTAEEKEAKLIKFVAVGDDALGKTSLLISCATDTFPDSTPKRVYEIYPRDYTARSGKKFKLKLWDTAGSIEYDRLRPLSYPGTDVILICLSVLGDPEHIITRWSPEVSHFCPGTPVILVGTQSDKRDQLVDRIPITIEKMKEIAKATGMYAYVECSALTGFNINSVIEVGLKAALHTKRSEAPIKRSEASSSIKKFLRKMNPFHKSQELEVQNKKEEDQAQAQQTFIEVLPKQVFISVLGSLDLIDIYRFGLVCRAMHELSEEPLVWIQLCQRRNPSYQYIPPSADNSMEQQRHLAPKKYMERCARSIWFNPLYN